MRLTLLFSESPDDLRLGDFLVFLGGDADAARLGAFDEEILEREAEFFLTFGGAWGQSADPRVEFCLFVN
ncbi:MAG: hypothetical protein ACHQT8_01610 [Chlamydiales bacterium]